MDNQISNKEISREIEWDFFNWLTKKALESEKQKKDTELNDNPKMLSTLSN